LLEVKIKKTFPGFKLTVAFAINQEILSLVGPSGSGKSLTLQCISGLMNPDEGYLQVNGKVLLDTAAGINVPPQKRKVGYVFQNYALFPHLTVFENIAFGLAAWERRKVVARVAYLLEKMRLSDYKDRYPHQLSGGQQQRVALARALAPEPEILLLDEPFSALDTQVRGELEREILALHQFYRGHIIFVSHNLDEAYRLGSQIAVYEAGQILQLGYKKKLINAPANQTVAKLTGTRNLVEGIIRNINGAKAEVMVPAWQEKLQVNMLHPEKYYPNQKVIIGIRPEYIRISNCFPESVSRPNGPGNRSIQAIHESPAQLLAAQVVEAVDGVTSYTYRLRLKNGSAQEFHLEADVSKLTAPWIPAGKTCYLHLPSERVFLITP